jgi:glucokinase
MSAGGFPILLIRLGEIMARKTNAEQFIIGIDIGGTKIAGGVTNLKGRLKECAVVPTLADKGKDKSLGQVFGLIERLVKLAGGKERILGIGICSPGPLNPTTGVVLNTPNLPGWHNLPLAGMVQERFDLPALLENDANAAGLAEVLFGSAVGCRNAFYVTLSTGIGTGIIIDRRIYHGKNGVAGEGGHVVVDHRSPYACGCGTRGCIEAIASGPGMARRARVLLEQEYPAPSLLRIMTRGDLSCLTPKMIGDAAKRRDQTALAILNETATYLGIWLGGIVSLLDPEAIVIGGGVSQIGRPLFERIREAVPKYTINRQFVSELPIVPAKLQTNVGVYGAASLFLPFSSPGQGSQTLK